MPFFLTAIKISSLQDENTRKVTIGLSLSQCCCPNATCVQYRRVVSDDRFLFPYSLLQETKFTGQKHFSNVDYPTLPQLRPKFTL